MPHLESCVKQCIEALEEAIQKEPDNAEIVKLLAQARKEFEVDSHVPVPAEKERFDALRDRMKHAGAQFDKLKVRYYKADDRGVHAARDIKKNDTILFMPLEELMTMDKAYESPIGRLMHARGLQSRLTAPNHTFLVTYIMQARRDPDSPVNKFVGVLPKSFDNFPIFFTERERAWFDGSPF